jgi:hypothetical protein
LHDDPQVWAITTWDNLKLELISAFAVAKVHDSLALLSDAFDMTWRSEETFMDLYYRVLAAVQESANSVNSTVDDEPINNMCINWIVGTIIRRNIPEKYHNDFKKVWAINKEQRKVVMEMRKRKPEFTYKKNRCLRNVRVFAVENWKSPDNREDTRKNKGNEGNRQGPRENNGQFQNFNRPKQNLPYRSNTNPTYPVQNKQDWNRNRYSNNSPNQVDRCYRCERIGHRTFNCKQESPYCGHCKTRGHNRGSTPNCRNTKWDFQRAIERKNNGGFGRNEGRNGGRNEQVDRQNVARDVRRASKNDRPSYEEPEYSSSESEQEYDANNENSPFPWDAGPLTNI